MTAEREVAAPSVASLPQFAHLGVAVSNPVKFNLSAFQPLLLEKSLATIFTAINYAEFTEILLL